MAIKHEDYLKDSRITAEHKFTDPPVRAAHHTGYDSSPLEPSPSGCASQKQTQHLIAQCSSEKSDRKRCFSRPSCPSIKFRLTRQILNTGFTNDGLHALDLANYVNTHEGSTLAQLSHTGITYTNASASSPSDSFPGLAALVTGGSPVTAGLWYDVTYNRALSPPAQTTSLPITGGQNLCPNVVGTPMAYDESIDFNLKLLNGGGGINPKFLPRDPNNNCSPVFPHQYLRVNTIFEVVKANGGTTAWIDKHPSYEWTNGPSGTGVDDFYGPEINSVPVALPQFPGCAPVPFPDPTFDDGWTTDFRNIQCYDSLHVAAIINQIDGFNHNRSAA